MCEDFAPNFADKGTGCCIMTTHYLTVPFNQGIFYQNQHDCHPPPTLLFLFPRLKIKPKARYFNTIEVIKAELQVVLNTITEHDFHDALKKCQKHW
jgi:hypothetical protein